MLIERITEKTLRVECEKCHVQRIVTYKQPNISGPHTCRSCVGKMGAKATYDLYGKEHYVKLGKRVGEYSKSHGLCRIAAKIGAQKGTPSKAGKVGGAKMRDSGKLKLCACPAAHSNEAWEKRFSTLRKLGKLGTSKPENTLYQLLVERFGEDDVVHHIYVRRFCIDFYIKSRNTYVEFDGTYWHGLDKPYSELTGSIKRKFDRDRRCDSYFIENGLRLIHITDKELKENHVAAINKI